MTELIWFLRGYWVITVRGASPDWMLNRMTQHRIPFWGILWLDELTVQVRVFRKDLPKIQQLANQTMCVVEDAVGYGMLRSLRGVFRPILVSGVLISFCLLFVLPRFLLFYEVFYIFYDK